jgi:hypothetical protein
MSEEPPKSLDQRLAELRDNLDAIERDIYQNVPADIQEARDVTEVARRLRELSDLLKAPKPRAKPPYKLPPRSDPNPQF